MAQSKICHLIELWKKLESGLCGWSADLNEETGESPANVFDQVQADRWLERDAKDPGLRVVQLTPSTAVRECADGVCA